MPNDNINGALTPRVTINGVLRERQRINGNMREGGGTSNYEELENLPAFNNIVIEGNQDPNYYGIAKLTDIPNINYSTNEINTGVKWIDGKYIYKKVFDMSNRIISDNSWTNNLLGTSNIYIIDAKGFFGLSGISAANFPYSYYRNNSEFFTWLISDNHSDIHVRPNMNAGYNITAGIVTIYYTKN